VGDLKSKCSATIKLEFSSSRNAKIFFDALKPETESPATPRSNVRISQIASLLILSFEASDTTALRASLNSYLSWLHLLNDIQGLLDASNQKSKAIKD